MVCDLLWRFPNEVVPFVILNYLGGWGEDWLGGAAKGQEVGVRGGLFLSWKEWIAGGNARGGEEWAK